MPGSRLTTAAIVLAFLLSGCVQNHETGRSAPAKIAAPHVDLTDYSASRPVYSLKEIHPFVATARDGTKLKGHVYVPDAPGPLATVLEYSPYFNGQNDPSDGRVQTIDGRKTMTGYFQAFMDAGYAVALVNLRGTGPSGSCFHWGDATDVADAGLVVDTLAAEPWSNGNVGMIGTSWPGWTQYLALASKSPHLKAIIPVSGVIDFYSVVMRQGAPLSIGPAASTAWNTEYSLLEATYPPIDSRGGDAQHTDCGDRYSQDASEGGVSWLVGDRNPYWAARDLREKIKNTSVPILFTNGLTNGEGHIFQFNGLWESLAQKDKRMLIGQWPHGSPMAPPIDWPTMRLAWFDHYLRGGPPLLQTGIVEYQDDVKNWHQSDTWPPRHNATTVYLSDHAIVADASQARASTQTFQSSNNNPCLGVCIDDGVANAPKEPVCPPTQAVYVSPPLKHDVLIAGNFHANLTISSTLPDGNLALFVYHTSGDGVCPDVGAKELRRALTDLRHSSAPDAQVAKDFVPATPTRVNLYSHPFAAPVKAGERLVVIVGGGSLELTPEPRLPALTVTTGGGAVGQITFPVVEGTLEFQ